MHLIRLVFGPVLAFGASIVCAQQPLEIIPLRHRTVEQVLPALQPLVEPGGMLSGSRGQLLLRASPANADEIRRALAAIDRPAKRLQISVRFDDALDRSRRDIQASGSIGSSGARIGVTADEARRTATERVDRRVQVLEGGRAFIFTGHSQPWLDSTTGFEVAPRIAGNTVVLEIVAQGKAQQAATTVTTRLGEWIEIAGSGSASTRRAIEVRRMWVKVEELD
jgi:hypothetical protein